MEPLPDMFKALGNSHRLTIVRRLIDQAFQCCEAERSEDCCLDPASCNVGELAEELDVSPPTVSYHLKELEQVGLIEKGREGTHVYFRINQESLKKLERFFQPGSER